MKSVKTVLLEKKSISYGLEFEGTKTNNLINGKGKNYNIAISTNASSNVEEGFSQRYMMMGHTACALVVIKGDLVIVKDPLDTDSGDIFTDEEYSIDLLILRSPHFENRK